MQNYLIVVLLKLLYGSEREFWKIYFYKSIALKEQMLENSFLLMWDPIKVSESSFLLTRPFQEVAPIPPKTFLV